MVKSLANIEWNHKFECRNVKIVSKEHKSFKRFRIQKSSNSLFYSESRDDPQEWGLHKDQVHTELYKEIHKEYVSH